MRALTSLMAASCSCVNTRRSRAALRCVKRYCAHANAVRPRLERVRPEVSALA